MIVHAADDQVWSFDEAEELHAMVPASSLVRLPGNNHILQADEPAFGMFVDHLERFLAG